jgi:nucleoside-diphosphate-sugar epimerase
MNIAVTGAFGYSGRYIAQRLLDDGHSVLTLTDSPGRRNPFGGAIRAEPFHFEELEKLVESLRGINSLINTYWVRFDHSDFSHAQAVANTKTLFHAARDAGVGRIVHISITTQISIRPFLTFAARRSWKWSCNRWAFHTAFFVRPFSLERKTF